MVRFFISPTEPVGSEITLTGENARHGWVLRLKNGEQVLVSNGAGKDYLCAVLEAAQESLSLSVLECRESTTEAEVQVSVYMAYAKGDKLEHVIQKATELGAAEIVAFPSARCVARPDGKNLDKKRERWQKIAAAAAEQSGRGKIPEVLTLPSYAEALNRGAQADRAILFFEHEQAQTLKMTLSERPFRSIAILTGPEGGLEDREVEQAREAGFDVCTLGRRILRCETAPLCAVSAIMYHVGEF